MGNLNNLYISQSFQSLTHLGTNTSLVPGTMTRLEDGIGQSLNIFFDGTNISSSGNIYGANITASVINTGSFVTTSSFNAYSQSVSSSLTNLSASLTVTDTFLQSQITALDVSGAAVSLVFFNQFTASQLNINSGYNTFTSSTNVRLNNLEIATQSLFVSASLALITASISNDDITFTKGDGSQFTIQVATGSFALSASYAETSSITRNVEVIARNGGASTLPAGTVVHITSAVGDNPVFTTASYDTELLSANTLGILRYSSPSGADVQVIVNGIVTGVDTDPVLGYAAGDILYLSSSGQFTKVQPQAPNQIVVLGQVLRAQQNAGSIYVNISNGWELEELHNVQINNVQTGDLIQYESSSYGLWKNKSIVGAGITTTSSFNSYTSSNDAKVNSLIAATGSYATTGSNTFTGDQTLIDAGGNTITLSDTSGSLMLVAKSFTSASAHLSSSANSFVNLIFKNSNLTADTIISGSNNIFSNPEAPTTGFKRYVGGYNNIFIASGSVPQITGSTAFPITINNNFSNRGTISIAGPISASASGIQFNILGQGGINIGSAGANNAEKLVGGITVNSNLVLLGAPTIIANQNFITGSSIFSNNQCITATTIAVSSSAVNVNGNTFNSGNNIRNAYWSSSIGLGSLTVARNIFQGATHVVLFTGSQPTGTTNSPQISDSQMMGNTLTAFVDVSGSDVAGTTANHSIISTMIQGYNTIVTGSSVNTANNFGSAFFGRYNAQDGNKSKTAQTVFAVGTGTASGRKTGFLIDSGSNTFVEGTFNVSGSSTFTGSVNITGSLLVNGASVSIDTASFATTGSNSFNGNQIITGSLYVSSSTQNDVIIEGQLFVSSSATGVTTRPQITVSGSQGTTTIGRNSITTRNLLYQNLIGAAAIDNSVIGTGDAIGMTVSASVAGISGWNLGPAIYVNNPSDTFPAVFGFQNKVNYTDGRVAVLTPLSASAGFTASLQNGYAWVGNASGQNTQVATSSFGTTINTGSFATTGSNFFNGNQTITGSTIVSGSFQTSQNITIWDSTGNPTLKIGRGGSNQPSNLAFGVQALPNNTYTGQFNIAIGNSAMQYISSSLGENIAIGSEALQYNQTDQQIAIGKNALRYTTTGNGNTAIGSNALENNNGSQNLAIGIGALNKNVNGSRNIAIGPDAGFNLTASLQNILIGYQVGNQISGSYNTIIGAYTGTGETINNNIILADGAGNKKLQYSGSIWYLSDSLTIQSGSTTLSGSLFIQSGSNLPTSTGSVLLTYNNVTGQVTQASFNSILSASVSSAEFWSTTTQSGSAGVSGSVSFNNSGSFYNISVVNGTQLQVGNAGVYNIQFSAQIETSAGADTIYLWFKKNGTNIGASASKAVLANNTAQIMTVNILDEAAANDYYEIAYQNINGHATVLAEVASGNIPAIPSVIATIFQIR